MRSTTANRITAGIALTGAILVGASIANPRHDPKPQPIPATTSSLAATTLAYPTVIAIPRQLAESIGAARQSTATACPNHHAQAWAEIGEDGTVEGVHAACVGP